MEPSPSWEATRHSATQDFLNILWNQKGSLSRSQEPSTGPYPEPDQSSQLHHILSKIHFIIIHPLTSWFS
jgi:hypothetical protein